MSTTRFILVAFICATPAILRWDGLITQGVVSGIIAIALVIAARTLRPGETGFLVLTIQPLTVIAAVPALWMMIQVLPIGVFAHPIWKSAAAALQRPIFSAISIDPGASVLALGQYLSLIGVAFLSASVAIDRQRAQSILFALTTAVTSIALILLVQDLFFPGTWLTAFARAQAIGCTAIGTIIGSAACIRTIEQYETRQAKPQRPVPVSLRTLMACSAALAICGVTLLVATTREAYFAAGYGLLAFASVMIIRRFRLGFLGIAGIATPALGVAMLLMAAHPAERGTSVSLAFAGASSPSLKAQSERVLDDAPLVGTGAGTFVALVPIYREINDPPATSVATTTAAAFAIELGQPMLWLIVAVTVGIILTLLRASLQRGRDSFYPAMGGSCLITHLLLAFTNPGLLGPAAGLDWQAAVLGLAFAQSKGRTA